MTVNQNRNRRFFAFDRSFNSLAVRKLSVAIFVGIASANSLFAQTWDGNGTPNNGGNWSTNLNWSTDVVPATGDTAILDSTGANRTIIYDGAASATLGTLSVNQSSAFENILQIQRSALAITNPITLSATGGGTSRISFNTANNASLLTATGGITLEAGGELSMSAYRTGVTNNVNFGNVTGNLNIAGGTLQIRATENNVPASTTTSAQNVLNGSLTMSSGNLIIDNISGLADRRLSVSGATNTVNITGGAISKSGTSNLANIGIGSGNVITFNPTTFDTGISITLDRNNVGFGQSFETNKTVGNLNLRGTGVKTITSSAAGTGTGSIILFDANSGSASSRTSLRLGSNLNLAPGLTVSAANFSQTPEATTNRIDVGIDTNGFTLDLSAVNGVVFTPNIGATGNAPVWDISGSGTVRARSFNFSTAGVTTNIGAGTTLNSTGGDTGVNTTTNNLSGTGTINPTSTFQYSGSALAAAPATLASNRAIGNLTVSSGALRTTGANAITAAGLLTVGSGASLDVSTALSVNGLTVNNGTITNPNNLTIIGTGSSVLKTGASTLTLSGANTYTGGTIVDSGTLIVNNTTGSGTGTGAVTVNSGAALGGSGTISGALTFNGGSTHSPGLSPGLPVFAGGVSYNAGSSFEWELTGNSSTGRGTLFDGVNVTGGTLTIAPGVNTVLKFSAPVDWTNSFWDADQSWTVFSNASTPVGMFETPSVGLDGTGAPLLPSRGAFSWATGLGLDSNNIVLNYTVVAVPEPSSIALVLVAGAGLVYRLRRKKIGTV